jgi:hypothetical protein
MDKELEELQNWLKAASSFELPSYKELPTVPLYMEQVIDYINETLKPLKITDKDMLTSFMVNNYVKADILKEPTKKKYTNDHLGYLLAITTLKRVLSMSEISMLIEMDKDVSTDKSVLYGFFKVMAKDILQESAAKVSDKTDSFVETYNREVKAGNPNAEQNLRDRLGLIALRLAIQAGVNTIMSQMILDEIGKNVHGEKVYQFESTPGHHELRREDKISLAQSKRLAAAKKEKTKDNKPSEKNKKAPKEDK